MTTYRVLHTKVIELGEDRNVVLRIEVDEQTSEIVVDVTVELSETECYGLEVPRADFILAMTEFLHDLREEP